eukprot:3000995-Prymnesium_polylepis.1
MPASTGGASFLSAAPSPSALSAPPDCPGGCTTVTSPASSVANGTAPIASAPPGPPEPVLRAPQTVDCRKTVQRLASRLLPPATKAPSLSCSALGHGAFRRT